MDAAYSGFAHADVAGVERMNITDKARTITAVRATGPSSLHLSWSEGTAADLDLGAVLADRAFAALRDPGEFAKVEVRSEEHTSELQSLMRISYAVFCLKKKKKDRSNKY